MDEAEQQRIFESWMSQHEHLILKVVRAYAFTTHDREDLLQEIVLQIWNSVPGFRGQSALTTWLYRVALYSAMKWSKRERKRKNRTQQLPENCQLLLRKEAAADPRLDWLYEQIGKLDEVSRSLTLLMLDGFSYREISEVLGISESNVGVRLNRIKKHLASQSPVGSLDNGL